MSTGCADFLSRCSCAKRTWVGIFKSCCLSPGTGFRKEVAGESHCIVAGSPLLLSAGDSVVSCQSSPASSLERQNVRDRPLPSNDSCPNPLSLCRVLKRCSRDIKTKHHTRRWCRTPPSKLLSRPRLVHTARIIVVQDRVRVGVKTHRLLLESSTDARSVAAWFIPGSWFTRGWGLSLGLTKLSFPASPLLCRLINLKGVSCRTCGFRAGL